MIEERPITLLLAGQEIEARIVRLTTELATAKLMGAWWREDCLKPSLVPPPIDRFWDWNRFEIEYEGRILTSEKVAVVTGEGERLAIQGAMMVSSEPIESVIAPGESALLVELLFTAPRNRPELRLDGRPFVVGVGTQLLIWAAWLSRSQGYQGRLRLDGSPEFIRWYEKRGLRTLPVEPIIFEAVAYVPMELPAEAARGLLSTWDDPDND